MRKTEAGVRDQEVPPLDTAPGIDGAGVTDEVRVSESSPIHDIAGEETGDMS